MNRNCEIHLFEEQSSSLAVWWARHEAPRTLVYLDAHLDLQKTGDDSLASLKACTSLQQVQALETPHHLNPSSRYAFGIENFLYAAHRLGLIDRLIWVAPPHVPRHYSAALVDYVQQMDGISFDELTGFRRLGRNAMRGTLLGLDITICDYDDLDSLDIDKNYYLDVDIDYFVVVPADRLWIDPAVVIGGILNQLGNPLLATISRAVSSGYTPLAFRFVGDYILGLLSGRQDEVNYYRTLTSAIFAIDRGNFDRARSECRQLIKARPGLASAYYILAIITDDSMERSQLLNAARVNDKAFDFDFACEIIGLLHRKKNLDSDKIKQLALKIDDLDRDSSQREQAEVALAQVYSASGNLEGARALLAGLRGDYADHEDVLLLIAERQLMDPSRRDQNKEMLGIVGKGVKNATAAQLHLADLEYKDKNYRAALEHYESAQKRAPAYMRPLEGMLASYRQLGLSGQAAEVERTIRRRQKRLDRILTLSD